MTNPFEGVTDPDKLWKIYTREKQKALQFSSSRHSIWKINRLQEQLNEAQNGNKKT